MSVPTGGSHGVPGPAISQVLIDRGISFRVDPMKDPDAEPPRAVTTPASELKPRRSPKARAKGAGGRVPPSRALPGTGGGEASAADRLRDAIARNLPGVSADAQPSPAKPPADD